jgi:hypothetical protein
MRFPFLTVSVLSELWKEDISTTDQDWMKQCACPRFESSKHTDHPNFTTDYLHFTLDAVSNSLVYVKEWEMTGNSTNANFTRRRKKSSLNRYYTLLQTQGANQHLRRLEPKASTRVCLLQRNTPVLQYGSGPCCNFLAKIVGVGTTLFHCHVISLAKGRIL